MIKITNLVPTLGLLLMLQFAGISSPCTASDAFPDVLSKDDQAKVFQVEQQQQTVMSHLPGNIKRVKNICMMIKGIQPPTTVNEEQEMDKAAAEHGIAGCQNWLHRNSPKPKGSVPFNQTTSADKNMPPQKRIEMCRGWTLSMMAKQRLLSQQCEHPETIQDGGAIPEEADFKATVSSSTVTNDNSVDTVTSDTTSIKRENRQKTLKKVGNAVGSFLGL